MPLLNKNVQAARPAALPETGVGRSRSGDRDGRGRPAYAVPVRRTERDGRCACVRPAYSDVWNADSLPVLLPGASTNPLPVHSANRTGPRRRRRRRRSRVPSEPRARFWQISQVNNNAGTAWPSSSRVSAVICCCFCFCWWCARRTRRRTEDSTGKVRNLPRWSGIWGILMPLIDTLNPERLTRFKRSTHAIIPDREDRDRCVTSFAGAETKRGARKPSHTFNPRGTLIINLFGSVLHGTKTWAALRIRCISLSDRCGGMFFAHPSVATHKVQCSGPLGPR